MEWQSVDLRRVSPKFFSGSQWERYRISRGYLEKYRAFLVVTVTGGGGEEMCPWHLVVRDRR